MSDFIVRFEGIELSKEHEHHIQAAIQKTVLAELSSAALGAYTPNPDDSGTSPRISGQVAYFPRKWWLGIWFLNAKNLVENPAMIENNQLTVGVAELPGQQVQR